MWNKWFLLFGLAAVLSSCRTASVARQEHRTLEQASGLLGIEIGKKDNQKLYIEAAGWIGVPYRFGGNTKRGIDCSGFVFQVYKKVYGQQVPRHTKGLKKESRKVSRQHLREGDLVFFTGRRSKKKVAHVGIYLKDGKFVHSGSSKGVTVSRLDEKYYVTHWLSGGRIKKTKETVAGNK